MDHSLGMRGGSAWRVLYLGSACVWGAKLTKQVSHEIRHGNSLERRFARGELESEIDWLGHQRVTYWNSDLSIYITIICPDSVIAPKPNRETA